MKKEYESPKAEKMDFDYKEAIVASSLNNQGPSGYYTNDPDGQFYKCGCTPYYARDWNQNCSE